MTTVEKIQQTVMSNRITEASELLQLAAHLLDDALQKTGPMNGLTSAVQERAREARVTAETLGLNWKEYKRSHLPEIVTTVDEGLTEKILKEKEETVQ